MILSISRVWVLVFPGFYIFFSSVLTSMYWGRDGVMKREVCWYMAHEEEDQLSPEICRTIEASWVHF